MFEDYKNDVILAYKKKKESRTISTNLESPTPGKLKNECLKVLDTADLKKDGEALNDFFETKYDLADYYSIIKRFDTDKFRPLGNFLKGNTTDSEDKNIELLAWLIDFNPRPYKSWQKNAEHKTTKIEADIKEQENSKDVKNESPSQNKNEIKEEELSSIQLRKGILKRVATVSMFSFLLIALCVLGYGKFTEKTPDSSGARKAKPTITAVSSPLAANNKKEFLSNSVSHKDSQCMYWTGDHYEPIACDQKMGEIPIISLDKQKAAEFKQIKKIDTITQSALKNIWYVKINGQPECFTASGFHPIYTDRKLRKLSVYMFNKYILTKRE